MLDDYKKHVDERAELNIPPLPLDADQTSELISLLKENNNDPNYLLNLLKERVPAGVDQAAYVKAAFLADITTGNASSPYISKIDAVEILGTMLGGYNVEPLIRCLEIEELAETASHVLGRTLLIPGDAIRPPAKPPTVEAISLPTLLISPKSKPGGL
jgi:aconitate hydratase 2/2-methylisocitrate dehydratase